MAIFTATSGEISEDLEVNVTLGNLKLLTSGVVYATQAKPITIQFDDVKINFIFEQDDSTEKSTFDPRRLNDKEVDFLLVNFNNPFGQGKLEPINLLTTEHFGVHLSFFVHKIGKSTNTYQLTYSLFYGDKNV